MEQHFGAMSNACNYIWMKSLLKVKARDRDHRQCLTIRSYLGLDLDDLAVRGLLWLVLKLSKALLCLLEFGHQLLYDFRI